jgi:hypothetical protein
LKEWHQEIFDRRSHPGGILIDEPGDEHLHLKLDCGDNANEIKIYNGSTCKRVYVLRDKLQKRWFHAGIKPADTHYVKAHSVFVFVQRS